MFDPWDCKSEEYFKTTISHDLFRMVCGKRIGGGSAREVLECYLKPDCVVKIEHESYSFQNASEWQTWEAVKHAPELAKWFAPCFEISPCGTILLQARTEPIRASELPTEVPHIMDDLHIGNWGMYKGHPVAHDYGYNRLVPEKFKMKKVKW